ncbi:DsrE family protein [Magnetovibrio sp.]|uniref:DsrE family protein n=1 Tax=Magnetovibrio sp. TaxID=2024836 RepID=UPI002F946A19
MRLLGFICSSIVAVALLVGNVTNADASERYGKQKVVYHINTPGGEGDKVYLGAMRNIQNHINAVGAENLDLKVVIHGNGIGLLQSAKAAGNVQTAVANLRSQSVGFEVCANTLKGKNIALDQLYEVFNEDVVPSGVAELARLQQMGYTYIKP